MPRINDRVTRENRQTEALNRSQKRLKRTMEEQVALLDSRLGKSKGAKKERTRLAA